MRYSLDDTYPPQARGKAIDLRLKSPCNGKRVGTADSFHSAGTQKSREASTPYRTLERQGNLLAPHLERHGKTAAHTDPRRKGPDVWPPRVKVGAEERSPSAPRLGPSIVNELGEEAPRVEAGEPHPLSLSFPERASCHSKTSSSRIPRVSGRAETASSLVPPVSRLFPSLPMTGGVHRTAFPASRVPRRMARGSFPTWRAIRRGGNEARRPSV